MSSLTFRGSIQSSALYLGAGGSQLRLVEVAGGGDVLMIENDHTNIHTFFQTAGDAAPTQIGQGAGMRLLGRAGQSGPDQQAGPPEFFYYDPQTHEVGSVDIRADGQYGTPRGLAINGQGSFDVTAATTLGSGPGAMLVLAENGGATLSAFTFSSASTLDRAASGPMQSPTGAGRISQLEQVTVGGKPFVLALNTEANSVLAYSPNGTSGLTLVGQLGAQQGLGISNPTEFEVVSFGDTTFVVVTATNSNSISVLRLLDNGIMVETDHVIDSLNTRFNRAAASEIVEVNGRAMVIAAGSDGGVTVMELLPNGRLTHVTTTEASGAGDLGNVISLVADVQGGAIQVYLLTETSDAISQFSLDVSQLVAPRTGSAAADVMQGTGGDDLLDGGLGNDRIYGGAGDDVILDGHGSDEMYGGAGADTFVISFDHDVDRIMDFNPAEDVLDLSAMPQVYGMASVGFLQTATGARLFIGGVELELRTHNGQPLSQSDLPFANYTRLTHAPGSGSWTGQVISGSAAGELLYGGAARDLVYAGDGDDHLVLGDGDDRGFGGAGNDRLEGGYGDDWLSGDDGNDTLFGGPTGNDTLIGGSGDDVTYGQNGADWLILGGGNDVGWGGTGDDRLEGGAGHDYLNGEDGDDVLFGGEDGNDTLIGGNGNDVAYGQSGNDLLNGGNGNDLLYGGAGDDRLEGGSGHDILHGDDGDDVMFGGADGDDTLRGGNGNDVAYGQSGNDLLQGGAGNDQLFGGTGADRLEGGYGHDILNGEDGDDLLFGGEDGDDTLIGGNGNDVAYGQSGNDLMQGGAGSDVMFGGTGDDRLEGGIGHDILDGEDGDDVLFGGGDGNDTLRGGNGNDVAYGQSGNDLLQGGAGNDQLFGGTGDDRLEGGTGHDTLLGEDGDDLSFGADGDDRLIGGNGNDVAYGQNGTDLLQGGAGNDQMFGGSGDDRLEGGDGNDILHGDDGNDLIFGGFGNDTLVGGAGNDTLHGQDGVDVIRAGSGVNIVSGGAGVDHFLFADGDHGTTTILDFADDVIDLTQVGSITGWQDLVSSHMTQSGGNVEIVFDQSVVILVRQLMADMTEDMFSF